MYANYESRIKEIISTDGVLNNYPEIEEPKDLPEGASVVRIERWKAVMKNLIRQVNHPTLTVLSCMAFY